jgi:ATP-dependent protease ClpP protease subunit
MTNKEKYSVTFKMDAATTALELSLYGPIGADMFGDGITDANVSAALKSAPNSYASITLRLNSPGGDLFQGVSIFNLIKSQGKLVNVVVDGLAASAASLVAMVGDTVVMQPGSMMMVHEAMAVCLGFSADMNKMAETLDSVTSSAADVYVSSTKLCKTKVLELMKNETWMTPKEAVNLGFATSAGTGKQAKVSNSFDLRFFKNVPEELKAEIEVAPVVAEPDVVEPEKTDPLIDILRKRVELRKRA